MQLDRTHVVAPPSVQSRHCGKFEIFLCVFVCVGVSVCVCACYLEGLVEEGLHPLRQAPDQSEWVPQDVQTQNQDVHLLEELHSRTQQLSRWRDQLTPGGGATEPAMGSTYLLSVVPCRGPRQLVPAVELVLDLEEGQPEGRRTRERSQAKSLPCLRPPTSRAAGDASHLKMMSSTSVSVAPMLFRRRLKDWSAAAS